MQLAWIEPQPDYPSLDVDHLRQNGVTYERLELRRCAKVLEKGSAFRFGFETQKRTAKAALALSTTRIGTGPRLHSRLQRTNIM